MSCYRHASNGENSKIERSIYAFSREASSRHTESIRLLIIPKESYLPVNLLFFEKLEGLLATLDMSGR